MISFVPLAPHHLPAIALQASQALAFGIYTPELTAEYGAQMIAGGPCWAGIDMQGRVIGAAGFAQIWPTQASAWALLSDAVGQHVRPIIEFVRWQVAVAPWARMEAVTRDAYPAHARFARACGFDRVGLLRNHGPICEDMVLFEVVKHAAA